jgi:hypothetical protein
MLIVDQMEEAPEVLDLTQDSEMGKDLVVLLVC